MTGQVRVGVVGLGYFGSFHVRHLASHARATLAAVVDADASRAVAVAATTGAVAFSDHRDLIGRVDAVSVAVPTSFHHKVVADLLDAGIHVLVEKPIASDTRTAEDLVQRARRRRLVLHVGHIERHSATFRALAERVEDVKLIECVRISPWKGRAADVDVVLDVMIHDIDLALALAGSPVTAVSASGERIVGKSADIAHARIDFANGATANLTASRVAEVTERVVRVAGSRRAVAGDLLNRRLTVTEPEGDGVRQETIEIEAEDALEREIGAFLDQVSGHSSMGVDGVAGLAALRVAEAIRTGIGDGAAGRLAALQPVAIGG